MLIFRKLIFGIKSKLHMKIKEKLLIMHKNIIRMVNNVI